MRRTALCVALVFTVASASASVLGIAPPPPPVWHPAQDLARDDVLDRIEALEDRLHAQGDRTDQEDLELAVLNLCTERPEDRLRALDILDQLARVVPDRLDVLLWTVRAHHHARDASTAIRVLEAARDRFEGQAAYHHALGIAYWFDARRHLKEKPTRRAIDELRRACTLQPTSPIHVMALASVCLITDQPSFVLPYLPSVEQGASVPLPLLILEAGLLSYDPETQEKSENLFGQAFTAMPAEWVGAFEHGGGRLPGVADGDIAAAAYYWSRVDPDPVRLSNRHRLEFWRRHLQADALWGDPTTSRPGWETAPGDAWIRWGRPTVTTEITPDITPFVGVPAENGPEDANGGWRGNFRTWIWTWAKGMNTFSLNFIDVNYMRDWNMSPESSKVYEGLQRDVPMTFSTPLFASTFELAIETALLATTSTRTSLISSIAIVASEDVPDQSVEDLGDVELHWALFDANEHRIDAGMILADPSSDRDGLLARLDSGHRAHDLRPARTARFGLDLTPGVYRVAIEGEDTVTGTRRWVDSRVIVNERQADRPVMSELMLAASFDPIDSNDTLPSTFVRFANALVPLPERVFPRAQDRAYVYFEVNGLDVEDDGRTRFSVSYRVTPIGAPESVPRIEEFVEERTGRSPDGLVVKGTAIDLQRLDPGGHELVVTVIDLVTNLTLERSIEFMIETPRERS